MTTTKKYEKHVVMVRHAVSGFLKRDGLIAANALKQGPAEKTLDKKMLTEAEVAVAKVFRSSFNCIKCAVHVGEAAQAPRGRKQKKKNADTTAAPTRRDRAQRTQANKEVCDNCTACQDKRHVAAEDLLTCSDDEIANFYFEVFDAEERVGHLPFGAFTYYQFNFKNNYAVTPIGNSAAKWSRLTKLASDMRQRNNNKLVRRKLRALAKSEQQFPVDRIDAPPTKKRTAEAADETPTKRARPSEIADTPHCLVDVETNVPNDANDSADMEIDVPEAVQAIIDYNEMPHPEDLEMLNANEEGFPTNPNPIHKIHIDNRFNS